MKEIVEQITDIRNRIEGNAVWSRSLDRPYQTWQRLVELMGTVAVYMDGGPVDVRKKVTEIHAYTREARELPKARRDPDFRILCDVLDVAADLLLALVERVPQQPKKRRKSRTK